MINPMVFITSDKLEHAQKILSAIPGAMNKAVKSALHRVGDGLKTDAVKETTNKYFLSASDIRRHLVFKKASGPNATVSLIATGGRRDISEYKISGAGKNLQVAVKKTGMKKLRTGFLSPNAKDINGKPIVLWRPKGEIKGVKTLSVPQAIGNKDTVQAVKEGALGRLEKRLDHEILRVLGAFK